MGFCQSTPVLDAGKAPEADASFGDHAPQGKGGPQQGAAHVGGPLSLLQRGGNA